MLASLAGGAAWDPDTTPGAGSELLFSSLCRDELANRTRSLFYGDIDWD